MELLATGNSICCLNLLYGDVVLLEFIHIYMTCMINFRLIVTITLVYNYMHVLIYSRMLQLLEIVIVVLMSFMMMYV